MRRPLESPEGPSRSVTTGLGSEWGPREALEKLWRAFYKNIGWFCKAPPESLLRGSDKFPGRLL